MTMIETAKAPQAQSHSGLLLDVKIFASPLKRRMATSPPSMIRTSPCRRARRSALWANPAPVNRKPPSP